MVNQPKIEIAFPKVTQNQPGGQVLIMAVAPEVGTTQLTANFTVRIVDPVTGQKIRGASVYVSYCIDGAAERKRNIFGSPGTTNEDGCVAFKCPVYKGFIRRIVITIECNGSSLNCGLLPPIEPAIPQPNASGVVSKEVTDLVSGPINLDDEPPAPLVMPPAIPPPPRSPSINDPIPPKEQKPEPLPIHTRTRVGVPMFALPLGTNPDDGVVSAPPPAEVFAESAHELDNGPGKPTQPPAVDRSATLLLRAEELLEHADELRRQFASSIRDMVELQRQLKTSNAALLGFPARAEAVLEQCRADIDEETREIQGLKKTFNLLIEGFDAKVAPSIESIGQKTDEAKQSINETLARLKTELERSRDEAITAIRAAGERERRSMVALPPVIPFHFDTPPQQSKWRMTRQGALRAVVVTVGVGSIAALIIDFIVHL